MTKSPLRTEGLFPWSAPSQADRLGAPWPGLVWDGLFTWGGRRRRLEPIGQSCSEWPFARLGQQGPGALCVCLCSGACTLLRTRCRRPRVRLPRPQHGCLGDSRLRCSVPPLPAKACLLGSLCSPSLPCSAGGDSLPQPQRSLVCVPCRRPALPSIQASRVKASHSLHPQSQRKQACRLWCLSTNLSPTSLRAGPRLLLCMASFFPMAAPAGLRPDMGITCLGSSHQYCSQNCQHTSSLPPFSDAEVFALIDVFPFETCLGWCFNKPQPPEDFPC